MSEPSIPPSNGDLNSFLDGYSYHWAYSANHALRHILQQEASAPAPTRKPSPRRRPPRPRRARPRSSKTTPYQAKRAAMEDLDIRRLRRDGFTPYFGDFRRWKTHGVYQQAFDRLLRDLKAAERKPES